MSARREDEERPSGAKEVIGKAMTAETMRLVEEHQRTRTI